MSIAPLRWIPAALLIALPGCRAKPAPTMDDSAPAFGASLAASDVAAYQRGREREIDALRSAGPVTVSGLDSLGAGATGLPVAEYRRMVESVDRYLKDWSRQDRSVLPPTSKFDSALAFLDSLRVERMVLAVRIER